MNNLFAKITLLIFCGVLLSGCVSSKAWLYKPEPKSELPVISQRSITVLPFIDRRQKDNSDFRPMALVPISPYGWQSFYIPEQADWKNHVALTWLLGAQHVFEYQNKVNDKIRSWNPDKDTAKYAMEELQAANIFRAVIFGPNNSADYALEGVIESTHYYGMVMTYGLSLLSPILWVLGAPVTIIQNEIVMTLKIRDIHSDEIVWEKEYPYSDSMFSWIYYTKTDFLFLEVTKEILLQATADIRDWAGNNGN